MTTDPAPEAIPAGSSADAVRMAVETRPPAPPLRPFPALRLLDAAGQAFDARKLVLAAFGIVLLEVGWGAIASLIGAGVLVNEGLAAYPITLARTWPEAVGGVFRMTAAPLLRPMSPFATVFGVVPGGSRAFFEGLLGGLWSILVWTVVGCAIARIALVQSATGERPGPGTALRFALKRFVSLIGGPLSTLGVVAFFALFCALFGLLYRLGSVGAFLGGVLLFVPLLLSLVMSLLVVGLAAGWPLMVATVAAEGEDSFDAVSRSYGYVFQRPVRYALYALASWLLGTIGLAASLLFGIVVIRLAAWGMGFGGPEGRILALFSGEPDAAGFSAARLHLAWIGLIGLLARSYAYSFFWSAAAAIYLLLRRDVDGAPCEDVYVEGESDEFEPAGLVGSAIADHPLGAAPKEDGPQ